MAKDLVVGVDASTTATKAVAWTRDGRAVGEGRRRAQVSIPRPGWHEQDPEEWWRSTLDALAQLAQEVGGHRIAAIGLTHQRESFACLDAAGRPLRPGILWLDGRCAEEVLTRGSERLHRITGKVPDPTPSLYKLMWLREHEPETLNGAARVVDVAAFLAHRLTGGDGWRTSWASADPMGLVDMERLDWSDEVLEEVGLGRDQLCELVAPGTVLGTLAPAVAAQVGVDAGVPVVAGAGDGQAAGLGANVTSADRAYLNLGTAVVSGTSSERYLHALPFRTLAGAVPGTYTLETLLRGGTYIVSWLVERFDGPEAAAAWARGEVPERHLEARAAELPPGSDGLLLVPYWNTAQKPPWEPGQSGYWDPDARGLVWGLRGHHTRAHVFRAVLEGITLEQRLRTEGVEAALGRRIDAYAAMGGGAQSALWCQLIADATRRPVVVCRAVETTSLGAAMLAAAAVDWYPGVAEAAAGMSGEGRRYEPDERRAERYDEIADVYRRLYPTLVPLAPALTQALERESREKEAAWAPSPSAATTRATS
jgi:xylulokinase